MRLERLRIDVGARPSRRGNIRGDAELRQQAPADEFDEIEEFIVEVGDARSSATVPQALFDADVQVATALRTDRPDAGTCSQRGTRGGLLQQVIERSIDGRCARRLDPSTTVEGDSRMTPEFVGGRLL